ncbi:MAG: flagellar motor switch protein FliN [Buchnera aphidicola (Microlophium carnosum)]|uniref:Flagellar motor switch protein FliN n=1 Tax=Buchnera aphidicola (Microlophium carnosum) TaxID=2708354 RepID=A0A6G9JUD9_9GAMM|nr:MAG: flagellar motor switch protein FliN [Buchnera aphidicola (Microlophium carnosum)]
MSNTQNNDDKKKSINSEKKISKNQDVNEDLSLQENVNKNILNDSRTTVDSKHVLLNTFVNITVELGKSKVKIKDFLSFSKGSMLILDKSIKESLDIFVNGYLIASGEIVVLEKKYGLRITSIKNSLKTINVLS